MSITVDATSSAAGSAVTQASLSCTHVVGTGATLLIAGTVNTTNTTVASVKLGSTNLTKLTSIANGTSREVELWYLINPTVGSGTLTVTWSVSARGCLGGVSFLGTDTGTPFGTAVTATGSASPSSVTVTAADLTLDVFGIANGNLITITVDGSQTQQLNVTENTGAGSNTAVLGISTKVAGTAMKWTQSGSGAPVGWAAIGVPINAGGQLTGTATITMPMETLSATGTVQNVAANTPYRANPCGMSVAVHRAAYW